MPSLKRPLDHLNRSLDKGRLQASRTIAYTEDELVLPTRIGQPSNYSKAVTGRKWTPGFVVYLYLH